MPKDKVVEARHQTQHKLETMDRYWWTWLWILAHAKGDWFCRDHLWLVDAMAGAGLHDSAGAPGGSIPGTPFQAVLAARRAQRDLGVVVHVRATDKNARYAASLQGLVAPYVGAPPDHVDARATADDWVNAVPAIADEIQGLQHGRAFRGGHGHRSLWLLDPYGVEPIDRRVIESLPPHSEVVVNFDENAMRRHAGKDLESITSKLYPDDRWKAGIGASTGTFARLFAESFPRWKARLVTPLRPTGEQERFFVHLADVPQATAAFDRCRLSALKAGTLLAGDSMTAQEKHRMAEGLQDRLSGQALTISEMRSIGVGLGIVGLRALCQAGEDLGYGDWDPKSDTMTWFKERAAEPDLGL